MIKKQITLFLIILFAGFNIYAENSAFDLDGTFEFSVNNDNLLRNEYIEAEKGTTFDSKITLEAIFGELLKDEALEIGMTFDIGEALSFIEGNDQDSSYSSTDDNMYDKLQDMIDWYINNKNRYDLPDYPGNYSNNNRWPTTDYGSGSSYQFIIGNTVEDINSVVWTDTKWDEAKQLFDEIQTHINDEIDLISTGDGEDLDQFDLDALSVTQQKLVLKEKEAFESFKDTYLGVSTDPGLGDLISDAYIKINNILGIIDVTMEYNGKEVAIGHALDSVRAKQENPLLGVEIALDLDEETMPDLSASALVVLTEGEDSTAEEWETSEYNKDEGEFGDIGILLNGKYSIKGLGSLEIEGGLLDAASPKNFVLGVYPTLDIWHMNKLKIIGEFAMIGYSDEEADNDPLKLGFGAALDAQVTFFGVTPRVQVFWKNDQFFGTTTANLEEDRLPGTSFMDDFNSSNVKMAGALDGSIYFDTSKIFGREIFSVGGGYNLFIYDIMESSRLLRHGWYANFNVTLKDLLDFPLTVDFSITKYDPDEQVEFSDYSGTGPSSSFSDGLFWGVEVEYEHSDNLSFIASCTGADSGYRLDTAQVVTWSLTSIASF